MSLNNSATVARTCTHPVGDDFHPCRRAAVTVYVIGEDYHYKCRVHDRMVRPVAEEKGVERRELVAA